MDIERKAFEYWFRTTTTYKTLWDFISTHQTNIKSVFVKRNGKTYQNVCVQIAWEAWQAAKARAVQGWISVEDNLPETEPNTDGVVCAVVCSLGNVYRARYVHDVDVGVDTKYWSEFAVNYNGKEYEHYEINAKITHWMPLPEPPTKDKGGENA